MAGSFLIDRSISLPHNRELPLLHRYCSEDATKAAMEEGGRKPTPSAISKTPRPKRIFKVIIIGDANVGKTCLSFRFCNGRFPEKTEATIGVDFRERPITIDGEIIRVQLWDTAGQERFRQSMVSHYYRNVHAVVFVYDLTKARTFHNLSHWISECRSNAMTPGELPMILVGNKCDITEEIAVRTSDAQKFADLHDMPLFETSAKADSESDHVEAIFMTLVHKLKECKSIHVQSQQERDAALADGGNKVVRLGEVPELDSQSGLCVSFCG